MTIFSSKGSAVGNVTQVRSLKCGYPKYIGLYPEDAKEVAQDVNFNGLPNATITTTEVIPSEIGCYLAVELSYDRDHDYYINFIVGTGVVVEGPSMTFPFSPVTDGSALFIFQITSLGTGDIVQVQATEELTVNCGSYQYSDPEISALAPMTGLGPMGDEWDFHDIQNYNTGQCWDGFEFTNSEHRELRLQANNVDIDYYMYTYNFGNSILTLKQSGTVSVDNSIELDTTEFQDENMRLTLSPRSETNTTIDFNFYIHTECTGCGPDSYLTLELANSNSDTLDVDSLIYSGESTSNFYECGETVNNCGECYVAIEIINTKNEYVYTISTEGHDYYFDDEQDLNGDGDDHMMYIHGSSMGGISVEIMVSVGENSDSGAGSGSGSGCSCGEGTYDAQEEATMNSTMVDTGMISDVGEELNVSIEDVGEGCTTCHYAISYETNGAQEGTQYSVYVDQGDGTVEMKGQDGVADGMSHEVMISSVAGGYSNVVIRIEQLPESSSGGGGEPSGSGMG